MTIVHSEVVVVNIFFFGIFAFVFAGIVGAVLLVDHDIGVLAFGLGWSISLALGKLECDLIEVISGQLVAFLFTAFFIFPP